MQVAVVEEEILAQVVLVEPVEVARVAIIHKQEPTEQQTPEVAVAVLDTHTLLPQQLGLVDQEWSSYVHCPLPQRPQDRLQ